MSAYIPQAARHDWATPDTLFEWASERWGPFYLDAAADASNAKCEIYLTEDQDALELDWGDTFDTSDLPAHVWLNPPYGRSMPKFVRKAIQQVNSGRVRRVVLLIAARLDTKVFHEDIVPNASEIVFLEGRVKFGNQNVGAPFPSCFVVIDNRKYMTMDNYFTGGPQPVISFTDWRVTEEEE